MDSQEKSLDKKISIDRRNFLSLLSLVCSSFFLRFESVHAIIGSRMRKSRRANSASSLYVDDVFSTYLYTGNLVNQTVVNGLDLANNGGMVWGKSLSYAGPHFIYDTSRSASIAFSPASSSSTSSINAGNTLFNSDGVRIPGDGNTTASGSQYVTWTFRKAPKFFDIVTYTGNGVAGRQIVHSLGSNPGAVIIKRVDSTGDWYMYHRKQGATPQNFPLILNSMSVYVRDAGFMNDTAPTTSVVTLGSGASSNSNGAAYVMYLFAHDESAGGIIQCGGQDPASGGVQNIYLGWEPQWVLYSPSIDGVGIADWRILDSMRGMTANTGNSANFLFPNSNAAENITAGYMQPTATGFITPGSAWLNCYIAIRRPNKPPTNGAEVFSLTTYNGDDSSPGTISSVNIVTDMNFSSCRNSSGWAGFISIDRLRGEKAALQLSTNAAEIAATSYGIYPSKKTQTGLNVGVFANGSGKTWIGHHFKRASGVFDIVCYNGTGSAITVSHSLNVAPEMIIVKRRNTSYGWVVKHTALSASHVVLLNSTQATTNYPTGFDSTAPTSTVFTVGSAVDTNETGGAYVAYLYATKAGISKVGSYTGNGSSQTINCNFTTGARFILIKRSDSTSDWYVWDSARGIVSGNDSHLSINTLVAEVTSDDSIDPDNTGFIVNQVAATNINVSSATYIFLSYA